MIPVPDWRERVDAHQERLARLTAGHSERAMRGQVHAIEDFIYQYYNLKVRMLRRWHPGWGFYVLDDDASRWGRWYTAGPVPGGVSLDVSAYLAQRKAVVTFIDSLLRKVSDRRPQLACFGLHEWAMVYAEDSHRHPLPLRLGSKGTDEVVESHELRCSHFDAYRFFTPAALPLNAPLSRDGVLTQEQPGCLHVGMDLLKWALRLGPLLPGELLLDSFELAHRIRVLDMRASPYDVSSYGYEPVAIETAEGKAEYVAQQRVFSQEASQLRKRILAITSGVLAAEV